MVASSLALLVGEPAAAAVVVSSFALPVGEPAAAVLSAAAY